MSWYRQYRPQQVADLHLASVRDQLSNMLTSGKLPRVLLFAGPRGAGKTTTARILAAMVNDPGNSKVIEQLFFNDSTTKQQLSEPDLNDQLVQRIFKGSSLVVQELDAASHRGIDDVRLLKERAMMPPAEGKVSVYILDEVHMFTTEAFNALLKLLEEPPAHVMFILATTELHKIPDTIQSRATTLHYTRASDEELVAALQRVLAAQEIDADSSALYQLAQQVDGSFRDMIKLAEYIYQQTGKLDQESIDTYAPSASEQVIGLIEAVVSKTASEVVTIFAALRAGQHDPKVFYKRLLSYLHQQLVGHYQNHPVEVKEPISRYLLRAFQSIDISESEPIPFLNLEVACLDLIARSQQKSKK